MRIDTYLNFPGNCQDALDFYTKSVGAEVLFVTKFGDHEPMPGTEGWEDKIMHSTFKIGETTILASDAPPHMQTSFGGFCLSVQAVDEDEADCVFSALADGGQVIMPLQSTFWAKKFGMLKDRFGVSWLVNLEAPPPSES